MERASSNDGANESYQCYRDVRYALVFGAKKPQPGAGRIHNKGRSHPIRG